MTDNGLLPWEQPENLQGPFKKPGMKQRLLDWLFPLLVIAVSGIWLLGLYDVLRWAWRRWV